MSQTTALHTWLAGEQDFAQGLELYAQHPQARPALVALMRRGGPGSFTTRQLVQELERLAAAEQPADQVRELPATEQPADVAPATAEQLPADVQALVAERNQLFKEASHLQGTLRLLPSDEDRKQAARTIKKNFRRIDEIWDALAYREKHGALPPVVDSVLVDNDPAAWTKRRNTLRTYLSSQRGTPDKRAAWSAEVAELERRLKP
ncbi:MAG: hypothetical protein ACRYFX_04540 [Janthinobacterium lividum]